MTRRLGVRTVAAACLAAGLEVPASATAGAWVPAPGAYYAKLASSSYWAAGVFDGAGRLDTAPPLDYFSESALFYGELGIVPRLGAVLALPWIWGRNHLDPGIDFERAGFGDLEAGAALQLLAEPVALAVEVKTRVPLYEGEITAVNTAATMTDERFPASSAYFPALGDGGFDLTPLVQVGYSFWPHPGWLAGEAGPRFRWSGFGDGVVWGVNGGYFVLPERLAPVLRVNGVQNYSANYPRPTKSYVAVGAGFILRLVGGLAFESEFAAIPTGRNTTRGLAFSAGLSFKGELVGDASK